MATITGETSGINKIASFNTYRTYSYINNSMFYPLVPKEYYDYYNRFVRHYFYWYDGFQPEFHTQNSGIFSTRIAYTLCNKLAGLINGGTLMFDSPDTLSEFKLKYNDKDKNESDALEFIERWSYDVDLTNKNGTAIEYALAGGDSIVKLNSDGETLYPVVLRKDNYWIDADFRGDITHFTGLVYAYTVMNKVNDENVSTTDYYYLLEERRYDEEGNPEYRLFVKMGAGNMTNMRDINFNKIQELPYEKLPREVKRALKRNYPSVKLGEWVDLPLPSIGIYMYKNSDTVAFMPQVPFGESLLTNLIGYLMSYDYYFSAFNTDLYLGRGRVLLPEGMQSPVGDEGTQGGYYTGLDSGVYNFAKYVDPTNQKPTLIQFDMRGDDWQTIGKMILRYMAMHLNISERTLANFLTDGSERATAREISVDDSTATFVENKRTLYRKPINKMLQDVLDFYEFPDEIIVRFSRVGLNNMNEITQQMIGLTQNNLIDIRSALEYIYADKNKEQLDTMYEAIKEEMKEKQEAEKKQEVTSDEGYEQTNNTDISHSEKSE